MAPASDLLTAAMEAGMITMLQDGILKAVEGITSMEEVQRVTGSGQYLQEIYEKIMVQLLSLQLKVTAEQIDKVGIDPTQLCGLPSLRTVSLLCDGCPRAMDRVEVTV